MHESELKEVIEQAKGAMITKEDFKAKVLGISGNAMRLRGRANSAKHKKQRELIFLIDALWDDTNPIREECDVVKKEANNMLRDVVIGVLLIVVLIAGLAVYLRGGL